MKLYKDCGHLFPVRACRSPSVFISVEPFCLYPDTLFLQGLEAIFKVGLSLMGSHKLLIMQHEDLESIVDVIKTDLPNLGLVQMEKTVNQVTSL